MRKSNIASILIGFAVYLMMSNIFWLSTEIKTGSVTVLPI